MDISADWKERVRRWFPELQEGLTLVFTSEVDYNYNCLAWAMSCNSRYFDNGKGCFWPWKDIPADTPEGWVNVCKIHGFVPIPIDNTSFVPGIEKVAILVNAEGDLHATRQGKNGWCGGKANLAGSVLI